MILRIFSTLLFMEIDLIKQVFAMPRWSEEKLNEAFRGLVQGSCDDPPEIDLKRWYEYELSLALKTGKSLEQIQTEITHRALSGEFD